LVTSATPSGASLVWFTNNTHTGTAYSTPTAAGAGTYYAFYFDAAANCYNSAISTAQVTVTTTACCAAGTTQVALSTNSSTNTCPSTTVNLNNLVTSATPSGASLVWFTNNTHSGTAYSTPTAAGAGTYYAFYYSAATNCYNSATSTAQVTVTNTACCAAGTTGPVYQ
jgi:hypothetical protein